MKRLVILVSILLTALATAQSRKPVYYDTFSKQWLDPAKWQTGLDCGPLTLECVREIQNGHLRLATREFGAPYSDSGEQYASPSLFFSNPDAIYSITADVNLRSFSGTQCSTNPAGWTHTTVAVGGSYFNTGSGDYADDIGDMVALIVDTQNPKTIGVSNWMAGGGLGVSTDMGSYPIGTTLSVTLAWDTVKHQFTSSVKVKDDPAVGMSVVVPYNVPDTKSPAWNQRWLGASVNSANCTSAQTFAQVEAFYDNVMINQ